MASLEETRSAAGGEPGPDQAGFTSTPSPARRRSRFRLCSYPHFCFDSSARIMEIQLSHKIVSVAELPGMLNYHYLISGVLYIHHHPDQDMTIAPGMSPGIQLSPY